MDKKKNVKKKLIFVEHPDEMLTWMSLEEYETLQKEQRLWELQGKLGNLRKDSKI